MVKTEAKILNSTAEQAKKTKRLKFSRLVFYYTTTILLERILDHQAGAGVGDVAQGIDTTVELKISIANYCIIDL